MAEAFRTNSQEIPSQLLDWPGLVVPMMMIMMMIMMIIMIIIIIIVIIMAIMIMTSFPMNANHVLISFLSPFSAVEHSWVIIMMILVIM